MSDERKKELIREIQELKNKLDVLDLSFRKKQHTLDSYIQEKESAEKELENVNAVEEKTMLQVELHQYKTSKVKNQMAIKNIDIKISEASNFSQNPRETKEGYEEKEKELVELKDKKRILQSEIARLDRDISRIENKLENVILGKSSASEIRQTINDLEHAIKSLKKDIELEQQRNEPKIFDLKQAIEEKEKELKQYD